MTDYDERIRKLAADLERDPGLAVDQSTFDLLEQASATILILKNRLEDANEYERELSRVADLLEANVDLGETDHIGLMEVADVLQRVIEERNSYKKMVQGFRERLNLLKMQHIELIEAEKLNCPAI